MIVTNRRVKKIICFVLIFAVSILFIPCTDNVWAESDAGKSAPDKTKYMLQKGSGDEEEASAEDSEGIGVHHQKATFQKNFDLTMEQKSATITDIENLVDETITDDMSDLEKYYTLAVAANKAVTYDWEFWSGAYNFDYYSHQWDSYGALNEGSVCAGIAIFYSQLCHAADLPCLFVITDPDSLDHTINYVPDVNGHAYYVDVTENMFFMSDKSNPFVPVYVPHFDCPGPNVEYLPYEITDCTDHTFDYAEQKDDEYYNCTQLKDMDGNYRTYSEWYEEFVAQADTTRYYPTKYEEKGSGLAPGEEGYKHVSYHDHPSNFVDETGVWFLDDFYTEEITSKILNKEFDEQLLNVSGIKKNYDCASQAELEEEIARSISNNEIEVDYFPAKEGDEVVAKVARLTAGEDFDVECTGFYSEANEAVLKVTGKGDYSGSYEITVKLNSAVVSKAPTPKKGLTYTGKKQDLIEPGEAEAGGEMQYAIGTKEEPTGTFGTEIPMEMNAGKYYVWYKAVGVDESHKNSKPERLEKPVNIAPIEVNIIVDDHMMVKVGDTKTISPKIDGKVRAKFTFESYNEDIAMVDENGVVTGLSDGYATISVGAELASSNYEVGYIPDVTVHVHDGIDISETKVRFYKSSFVYNGKVQRPTIKTIKGWKLKSGTDYTVKYSNKNSKNAGTYKVIVTGKGDYYASTDATYTIKKAPNTMSLKAKTVKVKYKKLKKKSKKIKRADAFTVSKAKGTLSYKLVSAKKGSKSYKSKFKVNSKSGKVTVKKRLKKGTYKVTVKVKAKGTANYKAGSKTVTFKIRVK